MRRAYNDYGWVMNEDGTLAGFALGYDFCAEHEFGASYLRNALGIVVPDRPMGLESRRMTQLRCPDHLIFQTFTRKMKVQGKTQTFKHALLALTNALSYSTSEETPKGAELAGRLQVHFHANPGDRWYDPEKSDIAVAWAGNGGFAIHVRGEENIERLQALHQAFLAGDIAMSEASSFGFLRKSLGFAILSRIPEKFLAEVRLKDQDNNALLDAFEATGIEKELKAAGLSWYALSPAWAEDRQGHRVLRMWLNPSDQRTFSHGWYSIEDLQDWAAKRGPVVDGISADVALKAKNKDYSFEFVKAANELGCPIRNSAPVWLDQARTQPGLRVLFHKSAPEQLEDGCYAIEDILARMREVAPVQA